MEMKFENGAGKLTLDMYAVKSPFGDKYILGKDAAQEQVNMWLRAVHDVSLVQVFEVESEDGCLIKGADVSEEFISAFFEQRKDEKREPEEFDKTQPIHTKEMKVWGLVRVKTNNPTTKKLVEKAQETPFVILQSKVGKFKFVAVDYEKEEPKLTGWTWVTSSGKVVDNGDIRIITTGNSEYTFVLIDKIEVPVEQLNVRKK